MNVSSRSLIIRLIIAPWRAPYAANDVSSTAAFRRPDHSVVAGEVGDGLTGVHADGGVRAYVWQNIFSFSLFVPQISREPLDGFAPNSQARRVWTLARSSLNVKVKGQRSR